MTQLDFSQQLEGCVRAVAGPGDLPLHAPASESGKSSHVLRAIERSAISVDEVLNLDLSQRLATLTQFRAPILASSGTSALHLALLAIGVGPGSKVLCPAISFVATANAILYCGGEPVFFDVEEEDLAISPSALRLYFDHESANSPDFDPGHPDYPVAVVAVSIFGLVPKLDELEQICREYNVPLVIDAAGALGSTMRGESIVSRGTVAITSFNGNKIVTAGAGGAVFSSSDAILERVRHLSLVAKVKHPFKYLHDGLGYNYRMPAINAALLMDQLENFANILDRKRRLHSAYSEAFGRLPLGLMSETGGTSSNYWLNSSWLPEGISGERVCSHLNNVGIGSRPLWEPLCNLPHLRGFRRFGSLPISHRASTSVVSFPSSYYLADKL